MAVLGRGQAYLGWSYVGCPAPLYFSGFAWLGLLLFGGSRSKNEGLSRFSVFSSNIPLMLVFLGQGILVS